MEFDKKKVYTALNADELKQGDKVFVADSIAHLRAKVEYGEDIETIEKIRSDSEFKRFFTKEGYSAKGFAYLVEKVPKLEIEPYQSIEEMKSDWASYMGYPPKPMTNPLIWIKAKFTKSETIISGFVDSTTVLIGSQELTLDELFEDFTYLDGSPIGKVK